MDEPHEETQDGADADHAAQILHHAGRRALGSRRRLRRFATLAWSAFVGAVAMMLLWLFLEPEWHETPLSFARLALTFAMCLVLAAIPALMMMSLQSQDDADTP